MTRRIIGILLSLALLLTLAAPGLAAGTLTYGPWVDAGMVDPLRVKREVFEDGVSAAWQQGSKEGPDNVRPYGFAIERKDGDGNVVSRAFFYSDGSVDFEEVKTPDGWEGEDYRYDGTLEFTYKITEEGERITTEKLFPDGSRTKTVDVDTGVIRYTAYIDKTLPDGRQVYVHTQEADGSNAYGEVRPSGPPDHSFTTKTYSSDSKEQTGGLEVTYDKHGKFVAGSRYDPATKQWVSLKGPPKHDPWWEVWMRRPYATIFATWFPNNTACSMGLSLRDRTPGFTGKWYHVTPLDLSRQGEQRIPMVASNMYFVGEIRVKVEGDSVTISYRMLGDGFDTARVHSEFLKLYPDLQAITSLEDDALTDGHAFNQPISIENDLNGDTKVVMLVRNILTYYTNYKGHRMLTRYWHNLSEHREYRTQLEALLD